MVFLVCFLPAYATDLGPNESYISLPLSYDAEHNQYYFSDIKPYCTENYSPVPGGNTISLGASIQWYLGTYPDYLRNPEAVGYWDCIEGAALPLMSWNYYPPSYDGDRSIVIHNGTNNYVLRYAVTGGVITAPDSPSFDYYAPFRPISDSEKEHREIAATISNNVLTLTPQSCDLLLSAVGGLGDNSPQNTDMWAKDRAILMSAVPPQSIGASNPDHWPAEKDSVTNGWYMIKSQDPGNGNPACPDPQNGNFVLNDVHLNDLFYKPHDGTTYFFLWSQTKTDPFYPNMSNATPIGYIPLSVTNGAWSYGSTTASTTCSDVCPSSVLFLPGIEGSRLYDQNDDKVWEPASGPDDALLADTHVRELFQDKNGNSLNESIHTKNGAVIDSVAGADFYGSFEQALDTWKSEGVISDWKAGAYDWRLSLNDLTDKGADSDGNISYLFPTDTPYLITTIRELASSSASGKVTIVAHSNGGLVAKALIQKLGSEAQNLVDRVIFVAVPQAGAPESLAELLYGQPITTRLFNLIDFPLVQSSVTRKFALNSPMPYHLLPSQAYFNTVKDPNHPVAEFDGPHAYATEQNAYGTTVDNWTELANFVTGADGRQPTADWDINHAAVGNPVLTAYAKSAHDLLDTWNPPPGIDAYQIAGWGVDKTVAGIRFYEEPRDPFGSDALGYSALYDPLFTEDGDGTVPVPSALMMSTSTDNVKRYWLDLKSAKKEHANILSLNELQQFIQNLIAGNDTLPDFVSTTPFPSDTTKQLIFFLHSPLTLNLFDSTGRHTGLTSDEIAEENIPNTIYGEFGEVKYIIAPAGQQYRLQMDGQASGDFTLEIEEQTGDAVTASTTFANIPTATTTVASLTITNGISDASPLAVDENGDGTTDFNLPEKPGGIAFAPYRFDGFLQPINDTAHQQGHASIFKSGSTVPVKLQLKRPDGSVVMARDTAPEWLTPQKGAAMSQSVSESTYDAAGTTGSSFKWDDTDQQYIYNWSTKGLAAGYWYKISVSLDDGTTQSVIIGLK